MSTKTQTIAARNVPVEAIEFLKPFAARAGHGDTASDVVRYAVIEIERRLREELGGATASTKRTQSTAAA